jgi:small subunit ribosomal protein S2
MKKMEAMIEDGTVEHMPNKEASRLRRRLAKLHRNLDGLRHMEKKPSLMFVIDPDSEDIAVHEANLAGVPVIAIVDTNCDPDPIDFLIPGNDDAIKATKLITARIADAVLEGREGRQDAPETAPAATTEPESAETEDQDAPVAEDEAVEAVSAENAETTEDAADKSVPADEPVVEEEEADSDAEEEVAEDVEEEKSKEEEADDDD